jgi:hypothetical protein
MEWQFIETPESKFTKKKPRQIRNKMGRRLQEDRRSTTGPGHREIEASGEDYKKPSAVRPAGYNPQ